MIRYDIFGQTFYSDYDVDPYYAVAFFERMWATEPVGTLSILLASLGLVLGLSYKLLDIWWDVQKEKARQGRLQLELGVADAQGLHLLISNIGKEPVVIKQIGFLRAGLPGREFVEIQELSAFRGKSLSSKALVEAIFQPPRVFFESKGRLNLAVKDSTGQLWLLPAKSSRKAYGQVNHQLTPSTPEAAPVEQPMAEIPRR